MSEGRAWFYLTLWKGTPQEFTSEISTEIVELESLNFYINTLTSFDSKLKTTLEKDVFINEFEAVDVNVIVITEVNWFVGR